MDVLTVDVLTVDVLTVDVLTLDVLTVIVQTVVVPLVDNVIHVNQCVVHQHLVILCFSVLHNSNPVVRQVAQAFIDLLVTLSRKHVVDLLMPHQDHKLVSIYTEPLRALPFMN